MVFFVGGAIQTAATSMAMMMVGRIIAGLGVGALSTIVPVYQSEISVGGVGSLHSNPMRMVLVLVLVLVLVPACILTLSTSLAPA